MGEINARLTEVTICALPESSINHHVYAVTVSYRGDNTYAVMHHGYALSADVSWDYEPRPSTAYRMAVAVAPDVVVNGRSAREVAADG